jgi:hypothetical protein
MTTEQPDVLWWQGFNLGRVRASQYTVVPTGYDDFTFVDKHSWVLTVVDGGSDYGWAVRRGASCLSRSGEWAYEPSPSSRTDEWLAEHRFPLGGAIERALAVVDGLRLAGMTAAEADAKWGEEQS